MSEKFLKISSIEEAVEKGTEISFGEYIFSNSDLELVLEQLKSGNSKNDDSCGPPSNGYHWQRIAGICVLVKS